MSFTPSDQMLRDLFLVSKAGRLRSGADCTGSVWHYMEHDPVEYWQRSLCGAKPKIMWSKADRPEIKVTCKKCARLAKAKGSHNDT